MISLRCNDHIYINTSYITIHVYIIVSVVIPDSFRHTETC
jgi:hypothetical protein